jgi:thiamine-phosphate pyrophosphorylase
MLYSKITDQLIDLNLNRLSEGLKVLEDITRFFFRDKNSLLRIRTLKRNLWKNVSEIRKKVIWARQSKQDLGRSAAFDIHRRGNIVDTLTANFKRGQEASRVLEELFKTINSEHSRSFKTLRFMLYDWEKELFNQINLAFNPRIYVILDIATVGKRNLGQITRACVVAGATMIQLREPKHTITKQWLSDAQKIKKAISDQRVKLIINDRADVAMAINADGIHIGKEDIPLKIARRILGDDKIIGVTVRNVRDALAAQKDGADYISIGSIYASPSKPSAPVVGIKTLKRVTKAVKIPVTAIGGITSKNSKEVFKTGVSGIAIVSSVFQGVDFCSDNLENTIRKNIQNLLQTR